MPAPTPNRGYVYATVNDLNDVPLVSQRLADAIDEDVQALNDPIPAGHLSSGATQNIPGTAWTELAMMGPPTGNDFTRGGLTKNSAGNRLIVPTTGVYMLAAQANWPTGNTNRRGITLTVNGVAINGIFSTIGPPAASGITAQTVTGLWLLAAGTEVGVAVFQDTTGTLSVNAGRLQVARVGF